MTETTWQYHKHLALKLIANNQYLAACGTYGVVLYEISNSSTAPPPDNDKWNQSQIISVTPYEIYLYKSVM